MPQFLSSKTNLEQQNLINYISQCKNQLLLWYLGLKKKKDNWMVWVSKYTHAHPHEFVTDCVSVWQTKICKVSCNFLNF